LGGGAAFYFDPTNPKEIAQTLLRVLKLDSRQLRQKIEEGKKQAEKFSWEKCAKKILETLVSVSKN